MDMVLHRNQYREDGIFSQILSLNDDELFVSVEHAYYNADMWRPKVPNGIFTCQRGMHRLKGMTEDFETFEILSVPHCTGILFHWGNWNENSEGCVLLGKTMVETPHLGKEHVEMVTNSRTAFAEFMAMQKGVDHFRLYVEG